MLSPVAQDVKRESMDAARFVYWSGFHPTANIRVTGVFTPTLRDNLQLISKAM
ncbi:hypothetical protein VB715_21340 [Crocosphaera sp. UHCC 0190]|uniref:hypothetical protein n=1 Tax=Crocosphaera sp. UHCC 0190 TaxID=3110246 RepID=UPI002B20471D|nr:hypothetical protein [Crocosphaera sp. UHCC 0190]MEA5512321.1 hypothetical protein [Crocosphaera sp. UHCC 0190]